MTPIGEDAPASIELRITACASTAHVHRDRIHRAMADGELPYHRDVEGFRVASPDDLLAWMRRPRHAVTK